MSFQTIYRTSTYFMLFLATLVLTYDSSADSLFALLHPLLVAAAAVGATLTADRRPELGLSRSTANTLAWATVGLVLLETWADVNLALAMGYWLVYLGVIKMFLPKTIQDDWFLLLVGLVQVVIGAFIGQSDATGTLLLSWALVTLWCLGLFHLHRESVRAVAAPGTTTRVTSASTAAERRDPYPGLLDRPFLVSSGLVALTTLLLGGVIFLAMPRWSAATGSTKGSPLSRHYTGFAERVRLGQFGEILENDSLVMSAELFDGEGQKIAYQGEPLWRGVVLTEYEDGQWTRPDSRPGLLRLRKSERPPARVIRQRIRLQPTDSPVLFALRPIWRYRAGGDIITFGQTDGTIARNDVDSRAFYEYEVLSGDDGSPIQPGEHLPFRDLFPELSGGRLADGLDEFPLRPEGLRDRIRAVAEPLVASIPPKDIAARAHALEAYLRDNPQFQYSLAMEPGDPSLDPVEDFLVNRKKGHCEYYASALALLLRSIGIPTRLVNGFKGGDYNEIAGAYLVRQKHAHSWVEALDTDLGDPAHMRPRWITLDPTPPTRDVVAAQVGGVPPRLRSLSDLLHLIWIFYIVGYNAERQQRLYQPLRALATEAANGFGLMWKYAREGIAWLLHFEDVGDFFSVRGFFVSTFGMLLMAGLYALAAHLVRRYRRRRRADGDGDGAGAGVAFYRRLVELLAAGGLHRPPAETPREFARRAALHLGGRADGDADVAAVPAQVVDAFYRVRFGREEVAPDEARDLDGRLDALEARLRPSGP